MSFMKGVFVRGQVPKMDYEGDEMLCWYSDKEPRWTSWTNENLKMWFGIALIKVIIARGVGFFNEKMILFKKEQGE